MLSRAHFGASGGVAFAPRVRPYQQVIVGVRQMTETATQMMDLLAEAAFTHLADRSLREIHIDDIAASAGVAPSAARAVAGSISALVLHRLAQLDRQAILESLADIEDAGDVPIRDKIVEALMHRFEVYAPYRAQIAELDRAARRDPVLGLRLIDSLTQAMRMLLRMAGDNLAGLRGEARAHGVALVAMAVARVWKDDDTPDLSVTLKDIDNRLTKAEEWGRTLRMFDDNAGRAGDADSDAARSPAGDTGIEGGGSGRYQ